MQITRISALTGKTHTREIDVTQAQLDLWKSGALIQSAMPQLSRTDREFVMTGATQEEWDETFGKDE
jgi:hypothetical protein